MEKDVFDKSKAINAYLNRFPIDEVNLSFNKKQDEAMRGVTSNLFDLLKDRK